MLNTTTVDLDDLRAHYDVIVIGAGPAGCATAASHEAMGASVLLVEANPKAARRFAGEWVHPAGVKILNNLKLLDGLEGSVSGSGFAVIPNDGLGAIQLEYGSGDSALACEHETLVRHLRQRVSSLHRVHYVEGARASAESGTRATLVAGSRTKQIGAARVIVAGGRSAQNPNAPKAESKVVISSMAGLLASNCELPFNGYGHVIVGGPAPVLAYRIADDRVRFCFDVPRAVRPNGEAKDWIWNEFAEVIPSSMREGVRDALQSSPLHWAANCFRPRSYVTDSGVAIVGDAAGVFHPLTAMGITTSVLDGDALSKAQDLDDYADKRARETYIPELLSNAIYQAFTRTDSGSLAIRDAIFSTWRQSSAHRRRTMRLLGGAATGRSDFVRAFSRVAVRAGATAVSSEPGTTAELVNWLRWPLASIHPNRGAMRTRSVSWAAPSSWSHSTGLLPSWFSSEEKQHAN